MRTETTVLCRHISGPGVLPSSTLNPHTPQLQPEALESTARPNARTMTFAACLWCPASTKTSGVKTQFAQVWGGFSKTSPSPGWKPNKIQRFQEDSGKILMKNETTSKSLIASFARTGIHQDPAHIGSDGTAEINPPAREGHQGYRQTCCDGVEWKSAEESCTVKRIHCSDDVLEVRSWGQDGRTTDFPPLDWQWVR